MKLNFSPWQRLTQFWRSHQPRTAAREAIKPKSINEQPQTSRACSLCLPDDTQDSMRIAAEPQNTPNWDALDKLMVDEPRYHVRYFSADEPGGVEQHAAAQTSAAAVRLPQPEAQMGTLRVGR
jgi:hypothetical protein